MGTADNLRRVTANGGMEGGEDQVGSCRDSGS